MEYAKIIKTLIVFIIALLVGGCQTVPVSTTPFIIPTASEASEVTATMELATVTIAAPSTPTPMATASAIPSVTAVATLTVTVTQSPAATVTATALLPTNTPLPRVTATSPPDILFGILDRGLDCSVATEIIEQLFESEFDISTETVRFNTREALFDALANGSIDITLCFLDPADRELMQEKLGHISQLGSSYRSYEGNDLQIWANGTVKTNWRQDFPCILRLFGTLDMTTVAFSDQDAEMWLQANAATVAEWTAFCALE